MAFRRQVQHQIRIGLAHRCCGGLGVAEIHSQQDVAGLAGGIEGLGAELSKHLLNACEVAGVAALVEVEHLGLAVLQQMPHHRTADEAGPAGDQDALSRTQQLHSAGNGCGNHDSGQ
jgi:hypothetical protein